MGQVYPLLEPVYYAVPQKEHHEHNFHLLIFLVTRVSDPDAILI